MAKIIVGKLNKKGQIEIVYDSIATAAKRNGLDSSNLRKAMHENGRQRCGGFSWTTISPKKVSAIRTKIGEDFGTVSGKRLSAL